MRVVHERSAELYELIRTEDVDGVLTIATLDDVAEAWCRYTSKPNDSDWWAIEFFKVRPLIGNRELHRAALLRLLEHATSDLVIGCIGAGPLEDFVTRTGSLDGRRVDPYSRADDESDLQWLETQAATNAKLRQALSGVWAGNVVSEQTMTRLDRAAGTHLTRPRPREEWPPEVRAMHDAEVALAEVAGPEWETIDQPSEEQRRAIDAYHRAHADFLDLIRRGGRPNEPG